VIRVRGLSRPNAGDELAVLERNDEVPFTDPRTKSSARFQFRPAARMRVVGRQEDVPEMDRLGHGASRIQAEAEDGEDGSELFTTSHSRAVQIARLNTPSD